MADSTGTLTVKVPGYPQPIQFADWTHDQLFHTVQFQAGNTNEVQAFIGGIGASIPNGTRVLSLVDTNIPRSGDNGLSEGWEALVYSIQIQIVREWAVASNGQPQLVDTPLTGGPPATAGQLSRPAHTGGGDPAYLAGGALVDFLRKTYVRFTVNQKIQSEGPAEKYPQGSGISVFGTTTDLEIANNGIPSPRDARAFVLPIWLRANIAYVCKLSPQAAYATLGNGLTDWIGAAHIVNPNFGFDVRVDLVGLIKRPVT
jgi:hypothetical protein